MFPYLSTSGDSLTQSIFMTELETYYLLQYTFWLVLNFRPFTLAFNLFLPFLFLRRPLTPIYHYFNSWRGGGEMGESGTTVEGVHCQLTTRFCSPSKRVKTTDLTSVSLEALKTKWSEAPPLSPQVWSQRTETTVVSAEWEIWQA